MSTTEDIRIRGKSYEPIKDTAKRYDKDKDKPVVTTNLVDKQKRKLDNLMARIDKPINIPDRVWSFLRLHCSLFTWYFKISYLLAVQLYG